MKCWKCVTYLLNLLERAKKVVVYFSPDRDCKTLRQVSDLLPLQASCPPSAMAEFETKIDLSSRITPSQPTLDMVIRRSGKNPGIETHRMLIHKQ